MLPTHSAEGARYPVYWVVVVLLLSPSGIPAQSGKEVYDSACAACHGRDGKGVDRSFAGFETPLPDFTDCNFATREATADWFAITHNGGPARGFSRIMPAYGEALTREQIDGVIEYVHGFCRERAWPRGDLNLPRAMVTEKAFPEDETVITTTLNAEGTPAIGNRLVYERRFGAVNQVEVAVPLRFERRRPGDWAGGAGDVAIGFKRALFHSLRSGSILSVTGEAVLPTGDRARGLGKGVTVFEPFLTYGQLLPSNSFVQFQGGVELPTHRDDASNSGFWRAAVGRTFSQEGGLGRAWSPMLEILADRDFVTGASTSWDLLPQLQVTLSKRQHIMANVGVRVPVSNTAGRPVQVMFYLLWDWFDGGLREGW